MTRITSYYYHQADLDYSKNYYYRKACDQFDRFHLTFAFAFEFVVVVDVVVAGEVEDYNVAAFVAFPFD